MKISELGEFGLIERLTGNLLHNPGGVIKGVGDDTAVLEVSPDRWLLFTTDMLLEGVHFSLEYSTFRHVGWKALAVNLSDIAAMGGCPTHAVVSLAVPPKTDVAGLEDLYEGFRESAKVHKVNIVGGDTVSSPGGLILNVTLLGEVEAGGAVYRSGARPGDNLYVTGPLGASAAGLHLFQNPDTDCPPEAAEHCRGAHTTPKPRVAEGVLLGRCGVSSMNDISDGLASEIHEICSASDVGCLIRQAAVPVDPHVRAVAQRAGIDPLQWALFGGEDLELVFTAGPGAEKRLLQAAEREGLPLFQVGQITSAKGVFMELPGGETVPLEKGGYNHFSR